MNRMILGGILLLAVVSCGKAPSAGPVFYVGVEECSKTALDTSSGVFSWEGDEEISITDASETQVQYVVSEVAGSRATLVAKPGQGSVLGEGPYTAIYGEAPSLVQEYSETAGRLPMSAVFSGNSFLLRATCALLEIRLEKAGESISGISVSGIPSGEERTVYSLKCSEPVSIDESQSFYILLPGGTYDGFVFTDHLERECTKSAKAGYETVLEANELQPISFSSSLSFTYPEGRVHTYSGAMNSSAITSKDGSGYVFGNLVVDGVTSENLSYIRQKNALYSAANGERIIRLEISVTNTETYLDWFGSGWKNSYSTHIPSGLNINYPVKLWTGLSDSVPQGMDFNIDTCSYYMETI